MPEITKTGHEVILGEGKILELVQFEVDIGGRKKMFEHARRPPGVRAVITKVNKILLTREYRREQGKYDYRLPGWKVMDTILEYRAFTWDILEAAKVALIKESQEEAGIIARNPELLHISHCGANVEWDLYYFLVTDFDETDDHDRDADGESDITTSWYTFDEVKGKILSGEMSEDRSIAVLLKWLLSNGQL